MDPREALERIVRYVTRQTLYLHEFECTVERDHGDGTLDLLPDDLRVRGTGLSRVSIRHGLPGVTVRVVTGSRVLLGFVEGDPRRPYASLWQPGSIEEISFDGGDASVARLGDIVVCSWPSSLAFTGTLAGAVSGTIAGTLTIATQSSGTIQSGAQRVRA
jgi:hypothetical protein